MARGKRVAAGVIIVLAAVIATLAVRSSLRPDADIADIAKAEARHYATYGAFTDGWLPDTPDYNREGSANVVTANADHLFISHGGLRHPGLWVDGHAVRCYKIGDSSCAEARAALMAALNSRR